MVFANLQKTTLPNLNNTAGTGTTGDGPQLPPNHLHGQGAGRAAQHGSCLQRAGQDLLPLSYPGISRLSGNLSMSALSGGVGGGGGLYTCVTARYTHAMVKDTHAAKC